jgi:hypothetical protein
MSIRLHKIALLTLLLGVFAGCVPSWNPLFTEQDLIFDAKVIGTWKGHHDELWKFEKAKDGEKHYKLSYTDKEGKATFVAFLLKIKERRFLNIYLVDDSEQELKLNGLAFMALVSVHAFFRVDEVGESLKLAACNPEWLDNHLKANPVAVAHLRQPNRILLTAETKDLQAFVMKHVEGEALFGEPFSVKRLPAK